MEPNVYLAVIFMLNSEPVFLEGWEPRVQPSMEACLERKEFMIDYLPDAPINDDVILLGAYCGTADELARIILQFANTSPV